ncbi:uncharacterized protein LOC144014827 isoform X2 [Festucalex cinctus]
MLMHRTPGWEQPSRSAPRPTRGFTPASASSPQTSSTAASSQVKFIFIKSKNLVCYSLKSKNHVRCGFKLSQVKSIFIILKFPRLGKVAVVSSSLVSAEEPLSQVLSSRQSCHCLKFTRLGRVPVAPGQHPPPPLQFRAPRGVRPAAIPLLLQFRRRSASVCSPLQGWAPGGIQQAAFSLSLQLQRRSAIVRPPLQSRAPGGVWPVANSLSLQLRRRSANVRPLLQSRAPSGVRPAAISLSHSSSGGARPASAPRASPRCPEASGQRPSLSRSSSSGARLAAASRSSSSARSVAAFTLCLASWTPSCSARPGLTRMASWSTPSRIAMTCTHSVFVQSQYERKLRHPGV